MEGILVYQYWQDLPGNILLKILRKICDRTIGTFLGPIPFIFMQFLANIFPNNRLKHHLWGWPPSGESWIRYYIECFCTYLGMAM